MLLLACTMMAGAAQAQTAQKKHTVTQNGKEAYEIAEEMPKFPGGVEALIKYLTDNLEYPKEAEEDSVGGRVIVSFVVDKEGNVVEPAEIVKSIHPALDAEALRVVKAMPRWTPGKMKGKPVAVKYTLPIMFNLSDDTKDAKAE